MQSNTFFYYATFDYVPFNNDDTQSLKYNGFVEISTSVVSSENFQETLNDVIEQIIDAAAEDVLRKTKVHGKVQNVVIKQFNKVT